MKDIGRWNLLNWEEGMEGWVLASYTRVLKVSRQRRRGESDSADLRAVLFV